MARKAAKRELIEPHTGDKRYVRRKAGKFTTSQDDASKSLSQDLRRKQKPSLKKAKAIEASTNLGRPLHQNVRLVSLLANSKTTNEASYDRDALSDCDISDRGC